MTTALGYNMENLIAQDIAHVLHPVTNLHRHARVGPLVLERGEGVYLWDTNGKRYLDGFAGLWNINVGHGRKVLAEAARQQIERVAFVPTFFGLASPPTIELATKLAQMIPGNIKHFQFTSGGAESNETAIKIARYTWALRGQPERVKILSRQMAYHGIANASLAATGIPAYHKDFGPLTPGFVYLTAPYPYRNGVGLTEAEFVAILAQELEDVIAHEGADTIAAMIGEPVQGAGGVVVPPQTYWQAIEPILKKHNILLIADEVITGFGRTGQMFGCETYGFQPDIISLAKGITSGYIPLGAVGISDEIFQTMIEPDRMFMHGFTYSGHPVACAVALENIRLIEAEGLPQNAGARGTQLLDSLKHLEQSHPNVGNVRGKGLMTLIEVVQDKDIKKGFDPSAGIGGKLQAATRKRGLLARCNDTGFAFAPPLIISSAQIDEIISIVHDALNEVFA
jgi:4-aminobutyrate--pyruvate transaminase